MSDIITIPAGVIMPKDLLMWLRKRRDEARGELQELRERDYYGDEQERIAALEERSWTYDEVIQHVSFGDQT